ncbi:MAG: UDP-N-acetylmuramoyl-tripeptide--D-alanyl-D-alanine ligase [Bryobacteraceae bacterium]|jgi:UDP-N-acetylmuramoyl-tripeptide--D-alanyl-D-alanine ligase
MTLNLEQLARAMAATGGPFKGAAAAWSVDSRTQTPGGVYFALRGERHDGHDFVAAALEKGAAAAVVDRAVCRDAAGREMVVGDTLAALQAAAVWARREWGGEVVAVTGSAGKTTTKDAIAHLLEVDRPVGRTIGNFNNHVGVPLSILRLPDRARTAVLEMGMNHAGEIRELASMASPSVAVVTNVGYAHVEFFADGIEGVAAAKRELVESLPPDGVAVLNADDARVRQFARVHAGRIVTFGFAPDADVRAEAYRESGGGARFSVLGVEFETGMAGRHAVMNLLAAIAVARVFGIAPERLPDAVRSFEAGDRRGRKIEHNGIVIWDDTYNSNPGAAKAMIDVLARTPAARRIAVLGEMLELGTCSGELHRGVGKYAAEHGVDYLIGVGGDARLMVEAAVDGGLPAAAATFVDDPAAAGEYVRGLAHTGDAVLFKGSRGVHVERALERFTA